VSGYKKFEVESTFVVPVPQKGYEVHAAGCDVIKCTCGAVSLMPAEDGTVGFPADLRESVPAHQATCSCHPCRPVGPLATGCCEGRGANGYDSAGQPWHIDPLCKVRPEARC